MLFTKKDILMNDRRLIEDFLPIQAISTEASREKSVHKGHISTTHFWWAWRPLAAYRAMLMALLLPDPCDAECPEEFISADRDILLKKHGRTRRWESEVSTAPRSSEDAPGVDAVKRFRLTARLSKGCLSLTEVRNDH